MVVLAAVTFLVAPAAASGESTRTVAATTTAEAWYRTTVLEDGAGGELCGAGLCPAVPANPYPEDTLHVGVVAGEPESVTVIALAPPPSGAVPVGGTLTVPLAEPEAGTTSPESSSVRACLATGPFEDVEGGAPEDVPPIDCGTSSVAVLDDGSSPMVLQVDLAPLVAGWSATSGDLGIALVASPQEDGGSWHLAFSGRDREAEGAAPISADLLLSVSSAATGSGDTTTPPAGSGPAVPSAPTTPPSSGAAISPPTSTSDMDAMPAPSVAPPQAAPPVVDDGASAADPVAAPLVELPYAYPAAWLLPLALLVGVTGLGHALRQEVTVREGSSAAAR